jgi:acetyl-CoA carboxylase carboxyl transferase subunit beta
MKEFFQRTRKAFTPAPPGNREPIPSNICVKCPACRELIYRKQLQDNLKICPRCDYHMRLDARERIGLLDDGGFREHDADLWPTDLLGFTEPGGISYADKLHAAQQRSGDTDAIISGIGSIDGQDCVLVVCNFSFMASSMGSVYGEKVARAAERAASLGLPFLTVNCSGGARMQEGLISLMQMPKTCMALAKLAAEGLPHISLLVDPCYGGVLASYASVADVIVAESGASIGFAGRRVIGQTIRGQLSAQHQTAEFLLQHGMVDIVVSRRDLPKHLGALLRHFARAGQEPPFPGNLSHIDRHIATKSRAAGISAWERVRLAREPQRPHTLDYIQRLCQEFVELHGDRRFGDDPAIVCGMASLDNQTVMVLGHQKGRTTGENVHRHFGMARPEGYRKAMRMFRLAEKFAMPVLCFIDTPGANPENDAEERGQAQSIAECILTMTTLRVPIIACIIGEGNSGGAIGIGVADRLLILENAIYMVISPEGCASILWHDSSQASEAARAMRITSWDSLELGVADQVILEPEEGAHTDYDATISAVGEAIRLHRDELMYLDIDALMDRRYARYRSFGCYIEREGRWPCEADLKRSASRPLETL